MTKNSLFFVVQEAADFNFKLDFKKPFHNRSQYESCYTTSSSSSFLLGALALDFSAILDEDVLQGLSVEGAAVHLDPRHVLHALHHLPEHHVPTVQPLGLGVGDEKLRTSAYGGNNSLSLSTRGASVTRVTTRYIHVDDSSVEVEVTRWRSRHDK